MLSGGWLHLDRLGIEQFTGDKAGFRALLEDYTPTGGAEASLEESLGRDLESYLRHVAEHPLVGTVTENASSWAGVGASIELRDLIAKNGCGRRIPLHPDLRAETRGLRLEPRLVATEAS